MSPLAEDLEGPGQDEVLREQQRRRKSETKSHVRWLMAAKSSPRRLRCEGFALSDSVGSGRGNPFHRGIVPHGHPTM